MRLLRGLSQTPKMPCLSLKTPKKMDNFVGRESTLEMLDEYLSPDTPATHHRLRSFAICGLGGIGKTELAVKYAYSRRQYFDVVFWLRANDEETLAADIAGIAVELGLTSASINVAAGRDIAMRWLSQPTRKSGLPDTSQNSLNWLLIYDNVDDLDVLRNNWPQFGTGSILITTRDAQAQHSRYAENGVNLAPLSDTESQDLIQRLTHVPATPSQEEALCLLSKKLDGLPLAINHVSAVFRKMGLSHSELLRCCSKGGIDKILERQGKIQGGRYLYWSLDRLSDPARALLQVISLLDQDNIPRKMLLYRTSKAKLRNYPSCVAEYMDAQEELFSSSLLNLDRDQWKLSLHRLVQDLVRLSMDEDTLFAAFHMALDLVIIGWPFQSTKDHNPIARLEKCEQVFPSVLCLKDGLKQLINTSPHFPLNVDIARLLNDAGR